MRIITNDKFESHPLLSNEMVPFKIREALKSQFAALDRVFNEIEGNFTKISPESEPSKLQKKLSEIKKNILGVLAKKGSVEEVVSFTHKTAKILNQISSDLAYLQMVDLKGEKYARLNSLSSNLDSLAEAFQTFFSHFKTDEQILKSTKFYEKTLAWAQNARLKLIREKKFQDHRNSALLKRLGDLEDKLKRKDAKSTSQFLDLVYNTIIDLEKTGNLKIEDGNQGMQQSYYVFDTSPEIVSKEKTGEKVGIFKPTSLFGEVTKRQLASYLIDKINGSRAHVPLTLRAVDETSGLGGTIQIFKNNLGNLQNLNAKEEDNISPNQIHYLTVHSLRLWNIDANATNILWNLDQEGKIQLTFIDHDDCLPVFKNKWELSEKNVHLAWDDFPQMNMPFDEELKAYIYALDPDQEAKYLIELGLPIESINLFKTVTWFIQEGAKKDLLPGEIYDYLLVGGWAISSNTPIIELMIAVQSNLKTTYPDPIANNYDLYATAFEKEMKQLIQTRMKNIKTEIELNGSSRRGTA